MKLYRKLKPLAGHLPNCSFCRAQFEKIKNCPEVKALPEGAQRKLNEHILLHEPCRNAIRNILDCPDFKKLKR